jgi:hypothetical protein
MNPRNVVGLALGLICLSTLTTGCGSSTSDASCSPVGFVTCSGNSLVTCAGDVAAESGTPEFVDCRATGQYCVGSIFGSASCSAPILGELCFGRNTTGCGATDQLLRCVWVSEQPEQGVSGDVGVWRVQTDCRATSQVCTIPGASCSAP